MAIILITDPNDSSVAGGLSNPDPVSWEQVLQGGFLNLTIDEFTSSEDVKNLFNLNPPPTFFGPFMVWGELIRIVVRFLYGLPQLQEIGMPNLPYWIILRPEPEQEHYSAITNSRPL